MVEKYLSQSKLWKKFLEETNLSPKEALKLAQDDGSYIGGEEHVYGPMFIQDEDKKKITFWDKTFTFSIVSWPYQRKTELRVKYKSKKETIPIS
jgi:hypothetical protein